MLTENQKTQFDQNGFLILENFVSPDVCQNLIDRAGTLINNFNPSDIKTVFSAKDQRHAKHSYFIESASAIHFFFEENAINEHGELKYEKNLCINKIGHALHDLDPVFNGFSRSHKLAQLTHDLGVSDPLLLQSMYICKQPRIGGEVTCHQDKTYLYTENQPVIGFWFALEDATLANGCLWAIPGGHGTALKARSIRHADNSVKTEIYDKTPWVLDKMVPLEVKRGSLIVLHGLLPHMSYENKSSHSRHAYTLHVISGNDHYPENNWLWRPSHMPLRGFF